MRPANGMGIYLFDATAGRELLWRDPEISCMYPIPVKAQPVPPVLPARAKWDGPQMGRFVISDVTRGLKSVKPGDIKSLRIVAVPPKTHPVMNHPSLGVTRDDPGKCVLGTVPVEADGSAHFLSPSGVIVFFQALDSNGRAVQTMRSVTNIQPGETRSCVGCHESRDAAPPPNSPSMAASREPSKITPGPSGSWPFRYDQLVQPVLDRACTSCHGEGKSPVLAGPKSYESLTAYGKPSLNDRVMADYRRGVSQEGSGLARDSSLVAWLSRTDTPCAKSLDPDAWSRLNLWLDLYGQRLGSYSDDQEKELIRLRGEWAGLLEEPAVKNP
jgi:mono/diheme cytochrome c family protein